MTYWARFFREIEVSASAKSPRPFNESVERFVAALKQSHLKIPVRLDTSGALHELHRGFAPFRPGSASIFYGTLTQVEDVISLGGTIRLAPFFRVYFQVFLILGIGGSLAVSGGAAWRWFSILDLERRTDFGLLEVVFAGLGVLIFFVVFVKFLATLNYLSTRGERDKIVAAFQSVESS
ncbi:MAG TPA: hypothetical protein VHC20_04520 [Candidatus Paceibacterota bacterium]|jgi:hypothetical protein|nr:hypothetical protein [Candidatus Paceibacterota bacterium]